MLGKISLKIKLVGAFLMMALLFAVPSYFSIRTINFVHSSFGDIVQNYVPRLNVLQSILVLSAKIDNATNLYETSQTASEAESTKNQLLADLEEMTDQEKRYLLLVLEAHEDEQAEIGAVFKAVEVAKEQTVAKVFELVALREQKAAAELIATKEAELVQTERALEQAITVAIEQDLGSIALESQLAAQQTDQLVRTVILVTSLAGVIALLFGLTISISIARNLQKLKEGSSRIASGDFSQHITINSKDELGQLAQSFNQMADSLRGSYRRLALEKQRDETLLESMSDGLIAIDTTGKIVLANTKAVFLLGLPPRERLLGVAVDSVLKPLTQDDKPLPPDYKPLKTVIETARPMQEVYAFHLGDGRKLLVDTAMSPVVLEGQTSGVIMVLRDVTHEKEVDRMKTEFISLASHQLRTPLSAIKWFSEMLLSGDAGKLTPEQNEFAKNVADSTERMIDLVNSLLNISRIESGRIIIDPKPTDLSELVSGIVNDLKAKIEERQQTLIVSVHKELPKVDLDARLIGQVFLNLLTNAIKYTPKGGEISVFVSRKDDQLVTQVTDNGYGIPKEEQGKMFQKFFRAANVAKVETDGTGLGLYLIKAIVESSGGKIWFESAEGKGTTFWFSLPMSGMKAKEGEVTLDA